MCVTYGWFRRRAQRDTLYECLNRIRRKADFRHPYPHESQRPSEFVGSAAEDAASLLTVPRTRTNFFQHFVIARGPEVQCFARIPRFSDENLESCADRVAASSVPVKSNSN